MQTYLFYDIETTGLNKSFDQILQFAAIRTDLKLNELTRYEFKIKLNPDMVPAPAAMLTHHMRLADIATGLSEYDAIREIHQCMNEPGTLSVGYNTLGFDDEFLRFSFYRNLLPPYTHQFANSCGRLDLYPITVFYFLYKNKSLKKWPEINKKISLKLEQLNAANQFFNGPSHDAMVDVEITLALAKTFFQEPDMWKYVTGFFNKKEDQERVANLPDKKGLLIHGKLGSENYFSAPVILLGTHYHYKNQLIYLKLDSDKLIHATPETLSETTFSIRKKFGEPGFILPLQSRFLQHMTPERLALVESNQNFLQQNPELFKKIIDTHCDYTYPTFPETDAEARLYLNTFATDAENNFCKKFHAATPSDKSLLTEKITNPNLKELATRILGRHFYDAMNAAQIERFETYRQTPAIIDFRGQKRLTPETALTEIAELRTSSELSTEQVELLTELESYLRQI